MFKQTTLGFGRPAATWALNVTVKIGGPQQIFVQQGNKGVVNIGATFVYDRVPPGPGAHVRLRGPRPRGRGGPLRRVERTKAYKTPQAVAIMLPGDPKVKDDTFMATDLLPAEFMEQLVVHEDADGDSSSSESCRSRSDASGVGGQELYHDYEGGVNTFIRASASPGGSA